MEQQSNKADEIIAFLAALFILLYAMFDPGVSGGLAIVFIIALVVYRFVFEFVNIIP